MVKWAYRRANAIKVLCAVMLVVPIVAVLCHVLRIISLSSLSSLASRPRDVPESSGKLATNWLKKDTNLTAEIHWLPTGSDKARRRMAMQTTLLNYVPVRSPGSQLKYDGTMSQVRPLLLLELL